MFWKYAANLQENIHAEVLKSHLGMAMNTRVFSCKFAAYFQNIFF